MAGKDFKWKQVDNNVFIFISLWKFSHSMPILTFNSIKFISSLLLYFVKCFNLLFWFYVVFDLIYTIHTIHINMLYVLDRQGVDRLPRISCKLRSCKHNNIAYAVICLACCLVKALVPKHKNRTRVDLLPKNIYFVRIFISNSNSNNQILLHFANERTKLFF